MYGHLLIIWSVITAWYRPRQRPWLKHLGTSTGTATARCTGCQAVRAMPACVRRLWSRLPQKRRRNRQDTGRRRTVRDESNEEGAGVTPARAPQTTMTPETMTP